MQCWESVRHRCDSRRSGSPDIGVAWVVPRDGVGKMRVSGGWRRASGHASHAMPVP